MRGQYTLTWIEAVALMHGSIVIGLTIFVAVVSLRRRDKLAMMLIAVSYALLTAVNVWGVFRYGRPDLLWFWVSLVAWLFGELGLWLYLAFGTWRANLRKEPPHVPGT